MPSADFQGLSVPLLDVQFEVKPAVSPGTFTGVLQVGSDEDPVLLNSILSNGDDISRSQTTAQVRVCFRH